MKAPEGIKKMQKGGFAFHLDTATGYRMITVSKYCIIKLINLINCRKK